MSLAAGPDSTDDVVLHHAEREFVVRAAAARLHARTLHAQLTDRRPAFFLLDC